MSHPASDIPPRDPRKKWSFNEVGVCECMNSTGLPFELNLFIRASVISLWYWGNRRPSESWHLCHGWRSRRGGEHPICLYPWPPIPDPVQYVGFDWTETDKRWKKESDVFVERSADIYTCSLLDFCNETHEQTHSHTHKHPYLRLTDWILQVTWASQSSGCILRLHNNLYLNPFLHRE